MGAFRPRLLIRQRPSYVSAELVAWLDKQDMPHIRGAPYHPMTQGKIERWHLTLKNRILLENYYLPGQLEGLGSKPSSPTIITCSTTRASTI